ncbi:MAG: glycine dehydrogenase (aminomethyl-transferring) [Rhodospirillaceae bacterium]|nr:glycine dehydrogenase (aminomethyl-transferring) [Rhodospirillaceae bacterium]|tara:strand:- start:2316 stop:3824 length:1509 start_codon:yes stop_codon:yes gene_type:complete
MNSRSRAHSFKSAVNSNKETELNTQSLIFELGSTEKSGVDIENCEFSSNLIGESLRNKKIGLPGLSEPEAIRYFVNLSKKNYSIDEGIYPLGSCTMKHNPRLNEKLARLDGFANLHPLQPVNTIQGVLELMFELSKNLLEITGMEAVALSPAAGAQGELCGILAIKQALENKRENRSKILVPDSAHGTNPSTAALCGYEIESVPSNPSGRINLDILIEKLNDKVAALMLTNPNTCGLFENDILKIAEEVHKRGAYLYCDGANFNAIVGKVKPSSLGIDAMHLNLHKTFSTPHGGGGPGSGPVVVSKQLSSFLPVPMIKKINDKFEIIENENKNTNSFGRLKAFHGQVGMFIRAYSYILSHGSDGLKQVAEDAVLNANYIQSKLKEHLTVKYPGFCMHEVLFDDQFLKGTEVSTLDFAKAMIDKGIHPMTIYFPLIASGAMLTEPTETESKKDLDNFCEKIIDLAKKAKEGNRNLFSSSPTKAVLGRLNETAAARDLILTYSE